MPAANFQIQRACKLCGSSFLAKTITSVCCSQKCSRLAYIENKKQEKIELLKQKKAAQIPKDQPYISVAEAVALYDIGRDTLYRLIRKEAIHSYNLGKRLTRVCRSDLEKHFDLKPIYEQKYRTKKDVKTYRLEKEDCYSIGEITKRYGISESSVYKHIRSFSIPTRQIGKYVYAPKSEIDDLYNAK